MVSEETGRKPGRSKYPRHLPGVPHSRWSGAACLPLSFLAASARGEILNVAHFTVFLKVKHRNTSPGQVVLFFSDTAGGTTHVDPVPDTQ